MHEGAHRGFLTRGQFSRRSHHGPAVGRKAAGDVVREASRADSISSPSMKKELGISILLVVLCMVVTIMNRVFLGATNLQNMARLIGMYGIFSIGMGIVIITGGIDLSVGSVFALLGVLLAIMLAEWHWAWPLAMLRRRRRWRCRRLFTGFFARGADAAVHRHPLRPALLPWPGALHRRATRPRASATQGFEVLRSSRPATSGRAHARSCC